MGKPYFVVKDSKDAKFVWVLHGGNGEPVAVSETYDSKQKAIQTAKRVNEIAGEAESDIRDETETIGQLLKRIEGMIKGLK